MRLSVLLLVVLTLAPAPAWAQTQSEENQTELIKRLLERIEALEKRLAELEDKQRSPAEAAGNGGPAAGETSARPARLPAEEAKLESRASPQPTLAPEEKHDYPTLQIRGFADLTFSATDEPGRRSGFDLGQVTFHVASALSKKVFYFGEFSFATPHPNFAVRVERSLIRYEYSDNLKFSFGRFHTPISYWNTAFHHGFWLQTSVNRPEMIQFHTPFLVPHFVGLLTEGNIPSGKLGLAYSFGVGNGRRTLIDDPGNTGDIDNHRAALVTVVARPARFYGLQVGGSFYYDTVTLGEAEDHNGGAGPTARFREWITSAHVVWTRETPEVVAEFFNVRHRHRETGHVWNNQAFYVQLAYRLPWWSQRWKPYYRFEYINTPETEEVFGILDLNGSVVGMRFDISDFAAFKAEYQNLRRHRHEERVNGIFVNSSFVF